MGDSAGFVDDHVFIVIIKIFKNDDRGRVWWAPRVSEWNAMPPCPPPPPQAAATVIIIPCRRRNGTPFIFRIAMRRLTTVAEGRRETIIKIPVRGACTADSVSANRNPQPPGPSDNGRNTSPPRHSPPSFAVYCLRALPTTTAPRPDGTRRLSSFQVIFPSARVFRFLCILSPFFSPSFSVVHVADNVRRRVRSANATVITFFPTVGRITFRYSSVADTHVLLEDHRARYIWSLSSTPHHRSDH